MSACDHILADLFGSRKLPHVATHYYEEKLEELRGPAKFLCGTNILYTHMANQKQWALPRDLSSFNEVCLLGVGMSDIGIDDSIDLYSRYFYKTVLSKHTLHSVRDERTKSFLIDAGIKNVVNTACPTMWALDKAAQERIPVRKSRQVLTSITDYAFCPELDLLMLKSLRSLYETVVIWIQGSHDVDWCLNQIVDLGDWLTIGPRLDELDRFIAQEDFDYIGTRLHAGIRCLTGGHRALVVAVDNRARQIGKDTNLPIIERDEGLARSVEQWANNPVPSQISLPWDEIHKWKSQFTAWSCA